MTTFGHIEMLSAAKNIMKMYIQKSFLICLVKQLLYQNAHGIYDIMTQEQIST